MALFSRVPERAFAFPIMRFLIAILCFLPLTGCIQFAANLMHVVSGPQVPPEFKGLDGKRIAVVALNESGICSDEVTIRLAGLLRGVLAGKLKKASMVNDVEVEGWLHGKSSREKDFIEIGKGVKADYVISVGIRNLKLKDGQTLFRGRSDIEVTVWDVNASKIAYQKALPEYTYPLMAGQATTETDEDKFRRVYLMNVADKVGRFFYAHDFGEDVAIDATILNY
jgi:hypothetical protein